MNKQSSRRLTEALPVIHFYLGFEKNNEGRMGAMGTAMGATRNVHEHPNVAPS